MLVFSLGKSFLGACMSLLLATLYILPSLFSINYIAFNQYTSSSPSDFLYNNSGTKHSSRPVDRAINTSLWTIKWWFVGKKPHRGDYCAWCASPDACEASTPSHAHQWKLNWKFHSASFVFSALMLLCKWTPTRYFYSKKSKSTCCIHNGIWEKVYMWCVSCMAVHILIVQLIKWLGTTLRPRDKASLAIQS